MISDLFTSSDIVYLSEDIIIIDRIENHQFARTFTVGRTCWHLNLENLLEIFQVKYFEVVHVVTNAYHMRETLISNDLNLIRIK